VPLTIDAGAGLRYESHKRQGRRFSWTAPLQTRRTDNVVDVLTRERTLRRIREICLGLPESSERLSHGAPTFFVREKRAFLMVVTDHHGDGRFAIWCAAAPGTQQLLVDADPERFFRPPYVGHRGWLGVRLDRGLDWDELAGIAEDAYAEVAPVKLVEAARLALSDQ
jgi:hypothetical protein